MQLRFNFLLEGFTNYLFKMLVHFYNAKGTFQEYCILEQLGDKCSPFFIDMEELRYANYI